MSFSFRPELKPFTMASATLNATTIKIGSSDFLEVVEKCLQHSKIGERAEYRITPLHRDFALLCNTHEIALEDKHTLQNLKKNVLKHYVRIEIEICQIQPDLTKFRHGLTLNELESATEAELLSKVENLKKSADSKFKQADFQAAITLYETAFKLVYLEEGPKFTDLKKRICMNLAFACHKTKAYERSIELSRWLIQSFGGEGSSHFKILFRLGMTYFEVNRFKEAYNAWRQAQMCVKEGSREFEDTEKKIRVAQKKMAGERVVRQRRFADAIRQEDQRAESASSEVKVNRVDDFEKVKLLGTGNFSVRIIPLFVI